MYTHWVAVERDGIVEACPVEVNEDGAVTGIVVGLTLLTDMDGLKETPGIECIYLADDIYELTHLREYWRQYEAGRTYCQGAVARIAPGGAGISVPHTPWRCAQRAPCIL